MKTYTERYYAYCADLNDGYTKQDIKRHNSAMNKLERMLRTIKNEPDKSFYLELLQSDHVRVRLSCAAHCLRLKIYIQEAEATLEELSRRTDIGMVDFEAEQTLCVWRKQGHLGSV